MTTTARRNLNECEAILGSATNTLQIKGLLERGGILISEITRVAEESSNSELEAAALSVLQMIDGYPFEGSGFSIEVNLGDGWTADWVNHPEWVRYSAGRSIPMANNFVTAPCEMHTPRRWAYELIELLRTELPSFRYAEFRIQERTAVAR
jgi:hypothetical protein